VFDFWASLSFASEIAFGAPQPFSFSSSGVFSTTGLPSFFHQLINRKYQSLHIFVQYINLT